MTAAHEQPHELHTIEFYPEHEPREHDPHYRFFNAARRRLKEKGLLVCAIKSSQHSGTIELHHSLVEYALQNGVDLDKLNELYGLHLDDEAFKRWIEEEGNLEPLCTLHHRGALGVHCMTDPMWNALRVWKDELPPPSRVAK